MRRILSLLLVISGCATGDKTAQVGDTSAISAAPVETLPGTSSADSVAANPESPPDKTIPVTWEVTADGIGPIKAGMTIAEANDAANTALVASGSGECFYVRTKDGPEGVSFMVENGKITRVDVADNRDVKTFEGAGIGDTESRILTLYPQQVTVQPHKYTTGHYLIVTPGDVQGARTRIVFETDGKLVTRFRSGLEPSVEYVEGCG
jgi:hypothetical protein